jgi:PAS domain S-box-containing protein
MKNTASNKVSIGFAITLSVLVINVIVAYQSIGKISENNRAEAKCDEVLSTLGSMLLTLKDVEIGERAYLLTNNPKYLPISQSKIELLRDRLKSLVKLQSADRQPIAFQASIERDLNELALKIVGVPRLRSAQVASPVENLPLTPLPPQSQRGNNIDLSLRGQAEIDRIGNILSSLDKSARILLDRLHTESRESLAGTRVAFAIAGLLDLLLLAILYRLVNWNLAKTQTAEAKLRDYAAEFEELYHNAPCGYHSLDATGKFVRINRTELQMLGYEEAELIGCKRLVDLLTPASIQAFNDYFPVVKNRGWIRDIEFQLIRKDGQIVPVSATVVAIKDADGNYLSSRSMLIDISDRMRLRKQTRLSAEISQKIRQSLKLDEILQTAVDEVQNLLEVDRVLIFKLDTDGSGTVVQEKVLPDYPSVMGSKIVDPCFDLSYHTKYAQGRIYSVADVTQAGFNPCYVEFLQQFAVKASSIVPIYLRNELWGLLIVHHCRSTRQWLPNEVEIMVQLATQMGIALSQAQLLEQEQIQRQELARSNAELEQFAHITSHDLQEPLRMVISYLQLLSRRYQGKLDPDADEFINYAVDGAVRMQALIQALLSYARVSSRKQPFDLVNCNLVVQDAISNLHVAITESAAEIVCDPLPAVWGDATQLTQVFQNLIANAIKFRRDVPPKIQISVEPLDSNRLPLPNSERWQTCTERLVLSEVEVSRSSSSERKSPDDLPPMPSAWLFAVADNGIGIESQYLDRIFVIFQRLHTRVTYPGTGIGLSICKKIIERHGGTIWVDSTTVGSDSALRQQMSVQLDSCGSIFYFIIPAVDNISPPHAHTQPHH